MAYKAKEKDVILTYLACCGGRSKTKKNCGFFKVAYENQKGNIVVKESMMISEEAEKVLGIKSIPIPYLIVFDKKGRASAVVISMDQVYEKLITKKDQLDCLEPEKYSSLEEFLEFYPKWNKKYSITRVYTEKPALMVDLTNPNLLHTLEPLPFREVLGVATLTQARQGAGYVTHPLDYDMVGEFYRNEVKLYSSLSINKFESFIKGNIIIKILRPLIRLIAGKKFKQYKLHKYLYANIAKKEKTESGSNVEWKTQTDCDFDFAEAVESISGKRIVSNGFIGDLNVRVRDKEQYGAFIYEIEASIDNIEDTKGLGVETEWTDKTASDFVFYAKKEVNDIVNKSKKLISRSNYKIEITINSVNK